MDDKEDGRPKGRLVISVCVKGVQVNAVGDVDAEGFKEAVALVKELFESVINNFCE